MKYANVLSALFLFAISHSARAFPAKRDAPSDIDILNFALTLEHFESAYYTHGLAAYSEADFIEAGYPKWTRGRFEQIAAHEKTHAEFLAGAITAAGAQAVQPCEYDFRHTDVQSFVEISGVIETVGTSAYNGAVAYISNKAYLTIAASILGVEARHAAWINSAVRQSDPWNTAFETPLSQNQAYTLATGFIKSCPSSNPPLSFKPFPALSIPRSACPGKRVELTFEQPKEQKTMYAAFLTGTGTVFVEIHGEGGKAEVVVPEGLVGAVYVVVTNDGGKVADETTVAGPAVVVFPFNSDSKVVCAMFR